MIIKSLACCMDTSAIITLSGAGCSGLDTTAPDYEAQCYKALRDEFVDNVNEYLGVLFENTKLSCLVVNEGDEDEIIELKQCVEIHENINNERVMLCLAEDLYEPGVHGDVVDGVFNNMKDRHKDELINDECPPIKCYGFEARAARVFNALGDANELVYAILSDQISIYVPGKDGIPEPDRYITLCTTWCDDLETSDWTVSFTGYREGRRAGIKRDNQTGICERVFVLIEGDRVYLLPEGA